MSRSKRVAAVSVGVFLAWVGLCHLGPQVPLAAERQTPATGSRVVRETRTAPPAGSVELRCQMEQPTVILSLVPPGETVKKGDLLVELDAAALVDKRIAQVFQVRKAEAEVARAKSTRQNAEQAGQGQIDLVQRALRLAQGQLKAFTEGEYPHQLALAQGTVAIAKERRTIAEYRMSQPRTDFETRKDEAARAAYQEAQMTLQEADLRLMEAEGTLTLLKSFVHDNKVAELELVVLQRQFELARAKSASADAGLQADIALSLAETRRQMEADRLARLDDQIVKCKIYAPRDGTVDQPRSPDEAAVKPGAVVREQQVLVRLLPVQPVKP